MSGGGGSRPGPTNTTVQTNSLPGFMEGPLKLAAGEAQNAYKSGMGSTPYPGATYIPPNADEMAGINQIRQNAMAPNSEWLNAATSANSVMNNQGLLAGHRNALQPAEAIASGKNRITVGDFEAGGGQAFNQALANASRDTLHGVNAQMASMGRLGSDAHSGVAADQVGELQTRARADQLNKDRQLQLQAQGANIANQGQTSLALGDQHGAGRDAMLRGAMMAPMIRDLKFDSGRRLADIGGALREESQAELQSNRDRFNAKQMQPWGQIGLLTSALQGFPNMGSVTSQSSGTIPQGSRISGLLGGAATGASVGSAFGPWGTAAGALLGGAGGAFM